MYKYLLFLEHKEGLKYLEHLVAFQPSMDLITEALLSSFEDLQLEVTAELQVIIVNGLKELSLSTYVEGWTPYEGVYIPSSTCTLFNHLTPDEYRTILDKYPTPLEFFLGSLDLLQPNLIVSIEVHAYADLIVVNAKKPLEHKRLIDYTRLILTKQPHILH